jgi:hypothetical protein
MFSSSQNKDDVGKISIKSTQGNQILVGANTNKLSDSHEMIGKCEVRGPSSLTSRLSAVQNDQIQRF